VSLITSVNRSGQIVGTKERSTIEITDIYRVSALRLTSSEGEQGAWFSKDLIRRELIAASQKFTPSIGHLRELLA
jgi:hypothetical protein